MKQFVLDRSGATPTLHQVPTEKIRIYASYEAAEADSANIAEGEIVSIADEGRSDFISRLKAQIEAVDEQLDDIASKTLKPGDTVEKIYTSVSTTSAITWDYDVDEDCWLLAINPSPGGADITMMATVTKANGTTAQFGNSMVSANRETNGWGSSILFPAKKGDHVKFWKNAMNTYPRNFTVWKIH